MRKHLLTLFLVVGLFGWLDLWNYFFQETSPTQETTVITEQAAEIVPTAISPEGDVQCPMCGGGSGCGGGLPRPRPPGRPK